MPYVNGQYVDDELYNFYQNTGYMDRPSRPEPTPAAFQPSGPITALSTTPAQYQPGSADVTGAMTAAMQNALTNSMNSASQGAYNQSVLTGFVMKPTFDQDGNWSYTYELDPSGNRISTIASQLTQAQIEDMAAKTALQAHIAAGVIKDPSTGQWIKTPDAVRAELQSALNAAQIKEIDANITLNQQKLAQAQSQFDRNLEAQAKSELDRLTFQREQLAQNQQQFTSNLQYQRDQLAQQNSQFLAGLGLDREKLAQANTQFLISATGYADGQATLARTELEAKIAENQEALKQSQQRIDDARRAGDLDREQQENEFARTLQQQQAQLAEQARQFGLTLDLQTGQLLGIMDGQKTLDMLRFEESQRQFNEQLEQDKAAQLALAVSDPTRLVEGSALANLYGGSKGGTIISPGQQATGAAIADQNVPGAFAPSLQGTVEQAQNVVSAINPLISLAPEINTTLAGNVAPAFGNPSGIQGTLQPLQTITPASGDFSKIIPAAFASLSDSAQKQYKSLAMARQPGLRPEDLVRNIRAQMPGSSSGLVPAAFGTMR